MRLTKLEAPAALGADLLSSTSAAASRLLALEPERPTLGAGSFELAGEALDRFWATPA